MARASGIWVVSLNDGLPLFLVAAFTVKRELVAWLNKKTPEDLKYFVVHRLQDGSPQYSTHKLTLSELMK